ncbi:hypothetical protein [Shinella kummerowiae]|uniref:hypothetical protein n=1 Tax=Shinella kummerowiae TaxID=417745 RepID=UPI0021B567B0|nr:hypothetical protein [Shinella kummerowiae]MCT7662345.1 hypothetical protein [Shinella kummerowiae]
MPPRNTDLGYWMGWAMTFAIAAAFSLYIVSQEPRIYRLVCDVSENNCGREWLAAVGGWFAIPTIIYLAIQVRDTQRHHREQMNNQYRPLRALAVKAQFTARQHLAVLHTFTAMQEHLDSRFHEAWEQGLIKQAQGWFSDPIYREFDNQLSIDGTTATMMTNILSVHATQPEQGLERFRPANEIVFSRIELYLKSIEQQATDYLEKTASAGLGEKVDHP